MPTRIAIGGDSNCGKSTLVASIYKHLTQLNEVSVGIHEIDVYSDTIPCILGIKPWEKRKKRVKAWFNPTISRRIWEFQYDTKDIVLGDLPGKITNPNIKKMIAPATAAIVVGKNPDGFMQWNKLFTSQGIPVLFNVMSYRDQLPLPLRNGIPIYYVNDLNRKLLSNAEIHRVANEISSHCRIPSYLITG